LVELTISRVHNSESVDTFKVLFCDDVLMNFIRRPRWKPRYFLPFTSYMTKHRAVYLGGSVFDDDCDCELSDNIKP